MTHVLIESFEERFSEITEYLHFLQGIDGAIKSGVPRIGDDDGPIITVKQQRILYSSVYLQLYNLVESSITSCLDHLTKVAMVAAKATPSDLSAELRTEWVRFIAKTHVDQGADKRLEGALKLCDYLISSLPVEKFEVKKGGGGNWNEDAIAKITKRLGFKLSISRASLTGIRRIVRNDEGALQLVVSLRNSLAHGGISFVDCGQYDTAAELVKLANRVAAYLREVVEAFVKYIEGQDFLMAAKRNLA